MKRRDFSGFASVTPEIKELLATLVAPETGSDAYRFTMQELGRFLATGVLKTQPDLAHSAKEVCVVCTVEDADFLAKGVLEGLQQQGVPADRLHLQCFWNEKVRTDEISLSPIIRHYEEPCATQQLVYVVVKSIISGACVVKTNLTRVLSKARDAEVVVVAPVLLVGAQGRLAREFPETIAKRFKYVWFATDHEKDAVENVSPGVGGSVYERLGLGDDKNQYVPEIVKERRRKLFGSSVSA